MGDTWEEHHEGITFKVVSKKKTPMMIHEQVASGSYGQQDFIVRRDLTGLHWQVEIGDETALFSLNDLLQAIIVKVVEDQEKKATSS